VKYIYLLLILIFPLNSIAAPIVEIKNKLNNTKNIYFKFIQKISNKIEKGECRISYPKKIYCKYDDVFEKVLVSNGRSLIINSKKIKDYLRYDIKDTPLNLILDKNFLIKKIDEVGEVKVNNDTFSFKINHKNSLVTIFFDNKNYDIKGWSTVDIYQNKVETILFNVQTNMMIDQSIFRIQKYIN
tara:strand:- start:7 stop:561 length:555 start_codon:yes stop_codon:yes gene_type:complete